MRPSAASAHKLKGSCQNIGAGFMAKLAADLEVARAADPAQLDALDRVFEDTRDALRAALVEDIVIGDARLAARVAASARLRARTRALGGCA